MHVEAFTNRTFGSRLRGYALGDELELCYAAERPDLAELSREDMAQTIFGELNPGDFEKPHSLLFPSLSIGDVISCRDGSAAWSLAVEFEGFSPVLPPPIFASEPEHAVYRRKVGD